MKKRILLFVVMMFCAVSVFAQDTHTDRQGIKYTLTTNGTTHTAEVSGHMDKLPSEIVIPATISKNETTYSVTSIGKSAFLNQRKLETVTIPNGVTSIGKDAFYGCENLRSITIPNSVTSIGERAFYNCRRFTSVTIPSSVTSIGDNAFLNCKYITDVYFYGNPDNLSWDGQFGFQANHVVNVHVPSAYLTKWQEKFGASTEFTFVGENSYLDVNNTDYQGIKYTLYDNLTADVSGYNSETIKAEIDIPETVISNGTEYIVTSIGDNTFYECSSLTSVTIPICVTSIGSAAFRKCGRLSSVTIPNSVTSIGSQAFSYCVSLNSVTIPSSVTSIGREAFNICHNLSSVTIERNDLGTLYFDKWAFFVSGSSDIIINCNIELKYTGTLHEGFSVAYDVTEGKGFSIDGNILTYGSSNLNNSQATLTTKEVSGALSITKTDDKYVATIDGNSSSSISLAEDINVASVTYTRNFEYDGNAYTIMLPFSFDASSVKGTFHTLGSITPDNGTVWKAMPSSAITEVAANTPYIFFPSESFTEMTFTNVTLIKTTDAPLTNSCTATNWQLHGVYSTKTWNDNNLNEYGFAATTDGGISAGEFVHFVSGASLKPTRCYLEYSKEGFSKSSPVLPERIIVVFPETSSVIEPNDPENNGGDVITPVSEIAPNGGTKVWSADKTIVIESKAGDQYRIIDLNGRTLRESRLASDREEVTLSHAAGIVVVIINGKTFKVNY